MMTTCKMTKEQFLEIAADIYDKMASKGYVDNTSKAFSSDVLELKIECSRTATKDYFVIY